MQREKLDRLSEGIGSTFGKIDWDQQWIETVYPHIERGHKKEE